MKMLLNMKPVKMAAVSLVVMSAAALAGCGSSTSKPTTASAKPLPSHPLITFKDPAKKETGAEIWAQNCMRCHQLRSPAQYNAAEWSVIIQYMRLKAGLTGVQAKKVLAFLQSASSH